LMEIRVRNAWESFCNYYDKSREDFFDTPDSFHGPHFREESDIVFDLARSFYNEFGDKWVHLESPVYGMYFEQLEEDKTSRGHAKRRKIDIEISSPESFMNKNAGREVFVEVKWVWRGINKPIGGTYLNNMVKRIEKDLEKLQYLIKKNCCKHAYLCIVDEEPDLTNIAKQKRQEWETKFLPVKILVKSYPKNNLI